MGIGSVFLKVGADPVEDIKQTFAAALKPLEGWASRADDLFCEVVSQGYQWDETYLYHLQMDCMGVFECAGCGKLICVGCDWKVVDGTPTIQAYPGQPIQAWHEGCGG